MPRSTIRKPATSRVTLFERLTAALGFVVVAAGAAAVGFMQQKPTVLASPSPATHPVNIPARGWRHIAVRTWNEFNADQIPQVAGGVAYFSLLSLFPAMAAFVSLYGLFADVGEVPKHLAILAGFLPRAALSFVSDEMTRIAGGKHPALGVAFAISLLLSLWSANGAVKALFSGLNTAYEVHERRNMIKLNLISLAFTIGGLVFVLSALGLVVAGPPVLVFLGMRSDFNPLFLEILRWPALFLAAVIGLSLLYRFGPSRPKARWRWITPGSLFATLGWILVSLGLSWYVSNFGHYEKTYGSLGAVVGFMTWLWLSSIVVLAGAELNSEIEAEAVASPGPLHAQG